MRVALYARVSSDKQDVDLSISAQLKALRDYAQRNSHLVAKEYVDEAESGRTAARPAFREMITAARSSNKPFDLILVWKYSRFARSREDSIVYKTMLRKNGVQVISINEPFEDTPTGRLLEAMIESLDEFYSANLGEEVTRGMRESASRGFYLSARPPFGYRKVSVADGSKKRTKLEVDPLQVGTVVAIFDGVLHGKGLIEIARDLNQRGIAGPKGKGWGKTGIRQLLRNEIYTGTFVWGRNSKRGLDPVRADNAFPAIVSREVFDHVQSKLRLRAPSQSNPRRTASRFLLSGLARCGYCDKALVGLDAKSGKFSYYTCGTISKKGAGSCPTRLLNATRFEALVVDKIKEHILTHDNLTELVKLINEEMDGAMATHHDELEAITNETNATNQRLERLYDALETGKIGLDELAPRIRELRSRQDKLQARKIEVEGLLSDRRVELADPEKVDSWVRELRDVLVENELAERKALIRSFVKEIKVTGNEVLLTYTMPVMPDGTSQEKGVLRSVQYGGQYLTRTLCGFHSV